jgi:hypothetical protein
MIVMFGKSIEYVNSPFALKKRKEERKTTIATAVIFEKTFELYIFFSI